MRVRVVNRRPGGGAQCIAAGVRGNSRCRITRARHAGKRYRVVRSRLDTFLGFQEITHVLAYDILAENLLDALGLNTSSGTDDDDDVNSSSSEGNGVPLFQELVSLTLVGVDFMRANEIASSTLFDMMELRQTSPLRVTTLDRIELRACTVDEDDVDSLRS